MFWTVLRLCLVPHDCGLYALAFRMPQVAVARVWRLMLEPLPWRVSACPLWVLAAYPVRAMTESRSTTPWCSSFLFGDRSDTRLYRHTCGRNRAAYILLTVMYGRHGATSWLRNTVGEFVETRKSVNIDIYFRKKCRLQHFFQKADTGHVTLGNARRENRRKASVVQTRKQPMAYLHCTGASSVRQRSMRPSSAVTGAG